MTTASGGRIPIGVMGATGTVGERMVRMLVDHPWFELAEVGASESSAGAPLGERISAMAAELPESVASLPLRSLDGSWASPVVLSALPRRVAASVEPRLARAGHLVVSNASAFRMDAGVPLVVPEINPDHLDLLEAQTERWPGALLTNPNCVVAGVALALAPLERAFGIRSVTVTTFQAISGAGRPGPPAGALIDNVLPWIDGEEEKLGPECRRILGRCEGGVVEEARIPVSATATRVPVSDGHLASVSVGLHASPTLDEVADVLRSFRGAIEGEGLPTAPRHPVELLRAPDRPQPRLDRDRGGGMTVTVGRLRPCEVLDVKLVVLSHNLVRGAAGAALLNAELCRARGWTERVAAGGSEARGSVRRTTGTAADV